MARQLRRAAAAPLVAVLALMLAAGCGGGGGGDGGETSETTAATSAAEATTAPVPEPLSLDEFGRRASAICRETDEATGAVQPAEDAASMAAALDEVAAIFDDTLGRMRALPAPAGREAEVAAWIDGVAAVPDDMRAAAAGLRADPGALESGLDAYWQRIQERQQAFIDDAWSLHAYGCAGADAPPPVVAPVEYAASPRPVVVDTDMAPDDWIALLYLLQRRDVDVRAVTLAGTGEAHCTPGVDNVRRLLQLAGQPDIPVACGRETPLQGTNEFPAEWRQAADGMLGLQLPAATTPAPAAGDAVALLRDTIRESPEPVALLTLGPVTNVAQALEGDPSLARRLDGVWVMGGAVGVPGNVDGGAPEWNLHVDPAAADAVLRSGADVTLVALDATSQVPVTRAFLQGLRDAHGTPAADFVLQVLEQQQAAIDADQYQFWDPLAAAALVDPTLITVEQQPLAVSLDGDLAGWTSIRSDGEPTAVAVGADRPRFEQVLLSVLNEPAG